MLSFACSRGGVRAVFFEWIVVVRVESEAMPVIGRFSIEVSAGGSRSFFKVLLRAKGKGNEGAPQALYFLSLHLCIAQKGNTV